MKTFLAMVIFGVILYLASSCDVNTHGLMEDDMGSQKLDLYTNGIFRNVCIGRAEAATVGESPMAYKPMDEIIKNIEPTCEIEKIIKPVYNFKAAF